MEQVGPEQIAVLSGLVVSAVVSLTLTPMMCSVLLKHEARHSRIYNMVESALVGLTNGYRRALTATLDNRWIVVALWAGVAALGGILFMLSDALLAINHFHTGIPLAPLWVLATYYAAQTFIALSIDRQQSY